MSKRIFKPSETVDFAVVGSGAAGGVIARELSQAGFSVVVLEQGDPKMSPQTYREDASQLAQRPATGNPLVYARIVGGSSAHGQ